MSKSNFIWLGTIVNTHGIKGELRILSNSTNIEKSFNIKEKIFIDINENFSPFVIQSFRLHKSFVLVTLEGDYDNINKVLFLKGKKIYIERKKIKDEFLLIDYIGYKVIDQNKKKIGEITNLKDIGPYEIIEVKFENRNYNFPFLEDKFVTSIDDKKRIFFVNLHPDIWN